MFKNNDRELYNKHMKIKYTINLCFDNNLIKTLINNFNR